MTAAEFDILCKELQLLVRQIPLKWGMVQNNKTDAAINLFGINNFAALEAAIEILSEDERNYFKRRWFLWQCSKCDEFLFCQNDNVVANPNKKDQLFDIEFNGDAGLRFDVKGTLIPKQFRNNVAAIIENPQPMINFFYENQSKGVRENYQNRLFIVHHSYRLQEREMYLRCHFNFKINLYGQYAQKIKTTSTFYKYQSAKVDVVFILENEDRNIVGRI